MRIFKCEFREHHDSGPIIATQYYFHYDYAWDTLRSTYSAGPTEFKRDPITGNAEVWKDGIKVATLRVTPIEVMDRGDHL